jgi:uncharacterized repeat protein (TIGR01451 family)
VDLGKLPGSCGGIGLGINECGAVAGAYSAFGPWEFWGARWPRACPTPPAPNLEITKSAGAATVDAGSPISFTIQVNVTGSGTANAVTLTDALPTGTGISWSIQGSVPECSITGSVLTCNFGNLTAPATRSVTGTSPTSFESCGVYDNTARVRATNVNEVTSNEASVTVQCVDLEIGKSAASATVPVGSPITFYIDVTNRGPATATDVVVTDMLPGQEQGITWSTSTSGCTIAGSMLTCNFASLAANESREIMITSSLMTAATCGRTYNNTARVVAANHPQRTSDTVPVIVQCAPTGLQGCTPGFWRNHPHQWQVYTTGQSFNAVFGVTQAQTGKPNSENLMAAVRKGGGGWSALGRHAVAALLNAAQSNVAYELTTAQVIARVQAAAADPALVESTKNELERFNERGCPLQGGPPR